MANYCVYCFIIFKLTCVAMSRIGDRLGTSDFAYSQKSGETGCSGDLTNNNTITDITYTPKQERSFLLDLFRATRGRFWANKAGWDEGNNTTHCKWFGVTCYENNTYNYVKFIDLTENGLDGQPPNFWRFRNLQGICLSRNRRMTGQISDVVSSNMTRLRRLCVSFSALNGSVPWSLILQLYNLEKLQICCMHTGLSGGLPQNIGRLNKLQVLSMGENGIKDVHLPLSIGKLTKLWYLDLEYVTFKSGEMWYFQNMTRLQYLHLTNCGIKGTLPDDFGQTHPNMIDLRLYGNNLEGELHLCFLGFKKITKLSVGSNLHLYGLLPHALGNLETLEVLDLSRNNFTGFAKNFTFSKKLQTLYIDRNVNFNVKGTHFLQALQPCKDQLRMLVARNCGLKGDLSKKIWIFDKIMYIDLSENDLTGHIPKTGVDSMAYLFYLSLASNNLSGDLPKSFFAPLNALTYLDLRGNPNLKTKSRLLNEYLNATFTETLRKDTFTCPTLRLTISGGRADVDPNYYGYTLCFCNRGYYGFMKYCKPCMEGASCGVSESPTQTFTEVIEIKMTINKGYWPCCGNFTNVTRMVKCSYEMEESNNEICSPSGKCNCQLKQLNGKLQTSCDTSCICRHGNQGRFCSRCKNGFYKNGALCVPCPKFRKNFRVVLSVSFVLCLLGSVTLLVCLRKYRKKLFLILIFALAVTLIVLHYKNIIPGWFFVIIFAVWILGLSGASENLESFLCIAVFFFQSLDAMFSDANIWPQTILLLKYQITNAFNFEISQLTCSFSNADHPEISFAVILLFPSMGISLIWLFYGLSRAISCCWQNSGIPRPLCKRLSIQILLFVYFPITAKTFQAVLPCERRDGLSYLKLTPWLDCSGTSYNRLLALGYVSLVVFVIGVPFFVFAPLLYKYVDHHGKAVSYEADIWLKPLYEEFRMPYRRYFPLVFLGRRLLLAVFLTVVPTTSSYQVMGVTVLLVIVIAITLIFRPFEQYSERFEFETLADVIVSAVLLLSFVGLALLRVSPKFDVSLVWLIISMNCIVVLSCVLGMVVLFAVNLWKSPGNVRPENVQQYEQIPD